MPPCPFFSILKRQIARVAHTRDLLSPLYSKRPPQAFASATFFLRGQRTGAAHPARRRLASSHPDPCSEKSGFDEANDRENKAFQWTRFVISSNHTKRERCMAKIMDRRMGKAPFLREVFDRVCIGQNIETFKSTNKFRCFRPQNHIQYHAFCDDFGPMNFGSIVKYIELLDDELNGHPRCKVVHVAEEGRRALTNAVFLLGAYLMMKHDKTADGVSESFSWLEQSNIESYRDATYSAADFLLSLHDCWLGLERAKALGWIQVPSAQDSALWGMVDIDEYETWDSPLNGDLHVVVPGQFVAFRGPVHLGEQEYCDERGYRRFAPSFYAEGMAGLGVKAVVRLNEHEYEGGEFERHGIAHYDLFFDDCTLPPPDVVEEFFRIVDECGGLVAVHCKAGLGRTGTLIALDMMRRHGFCARSAMGWLRIMRPGSVIGDQQAFLCAMEGCGGPSALCGEGGHEPSGVKVSPRCATLLSRSWSADQLRRWSLPSAAREPSLPRTSSAELARQVEGGLERRQRSLSFL